MKRILALFVLAVFSLSYAFSIDAKQIVETMEDVMDFESATFSAKLENTDRLGVTTLSFDAYQNGDGDTLLIVTSGFDKGQKILRLDDEIYIYYPDADEIIRLSDSGLKNSFLGSDFSYEDLTGDDDYSDRYDYKLVGEKEEVGIMCYEVEFVAKKLSETYQKQVILIDSERFVPLRVSLFSRSGKLLKEICYSEYIEDNGILFPSVVKSQNAIKKSNKSTMVVSNIVFDEELDDALFDKEELSW